MSSCSGGQKHTIKVSAGFWFLLMALRENPSPCLSWFLVGHLQPVACSRAPSLCRTLHTSGCRGIPALSPSSSMESLFPQPPLAHVVCGLLHSSETADPADTVVILTGGNPFPASLCPLPQQAFPHVQKLVSYRKKDQRRGLTPGRGVDFLFLFDILFLLLILK